MNSKVKKEYFVELCQVQNFFVPHADSNHLNAQDVVATMVAQAKNLADVGNLLHHDKEGYECSDAILQNLFWDISTKLEMIEKVLSQSFRYEE